MSLLRLASLYKENSHTYLSPAQGLRNTTNYTTKYLVDPQLRVFPIAHTGSRFRTWTDPVQGTTWPAHQAAVDVHNSLEKPNIPKTTKTPRWTPPSSPFPCPWPVVLLAPLVPIVSTLERGN